MATASAVETKLGNPYGGGIGAVLVQWTLTQADTVGAAYENRVLSDMCVQAAGTFSSGVISFQGSNDGTNWANLNDPLGVAISMSAASLKGVLEAPRYLRPSGATIGASANIVVSLYARRGNI